MVGARYEDVKEQQVKRCRRYRGKERHDNQRCKQVVTTGGEREAANSDTDRKQQQAQ